MSEVMSEEAVRLAAIRAQGQRMVDDYDADRPLSGKPVLVATIRDLLAALAATEQARDQARASLEEHRIMYDAATRERDEAWAQFDRERELAD